MNDQFTGCLAEFVALGATYKILTGKKNDQWDELGNILDDSLVNPFKGALNDLFDAGVETFKDYINITSPLDIFKRMFLAPLDNLKYLVDTSYYPAALREKIKSFLEQEGFALSLSSFDSIVGLIFATAFRAIAAVSYERKMLRKIDSLIQQVSEGVWDAPTMEPPIHPFKEALYHLDLAKQHYTSTRSQLLLRSNLDSTSYNKGETELRRTTDALFSGKLDVMADNVIDQAGLDGLIGIKNENGQVKFEDKQGLRSLSFLPPIKFTVHIKAIKTLNQQLTEYNSTLQSCEDALRMLSTALPSLASISKLLGTLVEFIILEITDVEKTLDGAATNSQLALRGNPTGTLQAQTESWTRLQADILMSMGIMKAVDALGIKKADVNDVKWFKKLKSFLQKVNPDQCTSDFNNLNRQITGFVAAYNARMTHNISSQTVISSGNRARAAIKNQLVYLDCFEEILNNLGLDKIPAWALETMAKIGAILAAINISNLDDIGEAFNSMKNAIKNFSLEASLVSQMKKKLDCIKKSCDNPAVGEISSRVSIQLDTLQKMFRSNSNVNKSFTKDARYYKKYNGNNLTYAIQQLINSMNTLNCP